MTTSERAALDARLQEVRAGLESLESKVDIEAWKTLYREKIGLAAALAEDEVRFRP